MTDRGLKAVVRVRAVRELDSRVGLAQALGEQRELEAQVEAVAQALSAETPFGSGTATEFLGHRTHLDHSARHLVERQRAASVAEGVSAASRARWQDDKSRLRAVELLVEHRDEAHRADLAHREAAQNDDIAAQRWARTKQGTR